MTKQHSKKSKKRKIRSRIPPRPVHPKPQIVPEVVQPDAKAASAKSSGEPREFPKNTRSITEPASVKPGKSFIRQVKLRGASTLKSLKAYLRKLKIGKEAVFWTGVGIACVLLVLVIFQAQSLWVHTKEKEQKEQGRAELMRQEAYWQGVVDKYQDYRDGYYNIALLAYQLGEQGRAEEYIQKALDLDPNFKQGKELEAIIQGKR